MPGNTRSGDTTPRERCCDSPAVRSTSWPTGGAGRPSIPRHLAAAQPGNLRRPDRPVALRPDPPAVAAGPGQAVDTLAAGHLAERRDSGQGRAGARPLRHLPGLRRDRRHRHQRGPGRARALPGRPARRAGRHESPPGAHRAAQRLPAGHPPAPLGRPVAGHRDVLPRRLPQARPAAAPRAAGTGHGAAGKPRQPQPLGQSRLPADHPHLDPLRPAPGRCAAAVLRLHHPRRRRRCTCATGTTR